MDSSSRLSPAKTSGRAIQADLVRRTREGWISNRQEASAILGIAPSTAGDYIAQLVGAGILREERQASGRVGRPQHRFEVNPEAGHFIGIDFESNTLMAQVVDFACRPVYRERRSLTEGRVRAEAMLGELESLVETALDACPGAVCGVGIGVPGLIDASSGRALDYPLIEGWRGVAIRERFERRFGLPVRIDNTARCGARAEKLFGGARRLTDFVCLVNRGGLGVAAYEKGEALTGARGVFGELGRTAGLLAGVPGGRTLESAASYRALFGGWSAGGGEPDWSRIRERIEAGDPEAREAVERAVTLLGRTFALLAAVFNPEALFLQSPAVELGEGFRRRLEEVMADACGLPASHLPRLEFSWLGFYAGAMGAAALAVESWEPTEPGSRSLAGVGAEAGGDAV